MTTSPRAKSGRCRPPAGRRDAGGHSLVGLLGVVDRGGDAHRPATPLVDGEPVVTHRSGAFFSKGEYDDSVVVDTVARVIGRPPRAFHEWATAHAHLF
jgi:hypothetical protein